MFHTAFPMGGSAGQGAGSPSSVWAVTTWLSLGPYRLCILHPGSRVSRRATAGVTWSCSPAGRSSRRRSGSGAPSSTSSAICRSATKGRNIRSIRACERSGTQRVASFCTSPGITTSAPPVVQVEKISWNEASKLRVENWSVRVPVSYPGCACCQARRFASVRCGTPTALGRPVEPEVKMTYISVSSDAPARGSSSGMAAISAASRSTHTATVSAGKRPRSDSSVTTTEAPASSSISRRRSSG